MAKRVYELAKEMGVDNASLMKFLKEQIIKIEFMELKKSFKGYKISK